LIWELENRKYKKRGNDFQVNKKKSGETATKLQTDKAWQLFNSTLVKISNNHPANNAF
jgi:hypothetical protein